VSAGDQIPQFSRITVDLITRHPVHGHAGLPDLFQHGHGLLGLGLEAHGLRHLGLGPPLGIVAPLFRQIQPAIQEHVAFGCRITQKRAHLAVLDLARRAAVLAFHADRAGTLLDEARLVDHADAIFVREDLNDILLQEVAGAIRRP
jgi:hypothetical protein